MVVLFTEIMDEESVVRRVVEACYMVSSVMFIFSLSGLKKPDTSRKGVFFGVCGMAIAIVSSLFLQDFHSQYVKLIFAMLPGAIVGMVMAFMVNMLQVPQMIASLHTFVGIAATLVGFSNYFLLRGAAPSVLKDIETYVGIFIGVVTFAGSVIAALKLAEVGGGDFGGFVFKLGWARHLINILALLVTVVAGIVFCSDDSWVMGLYINVIMGIFVGCHMVLAVGAADMPVIISMLNSYSGWATAASGFLLNNNVLIVTGAVVGSSGAILSYIMCKAMNRSFLQVLLTRFGGPGTTHHVSTPDVATNEVNAKQVYEILHQAKDIIIVPGYGMAAGKAQHQVGQLAKTLRKMGKKVRFCLHPVAGRMPGHMNILLSEAKVPINIMSELSNINADFEKADVALVIGCNDTVNPAAYEEGSPIFGMAVCDVWKAKKVIVMKRKRAGAGFAGIDNLMFDYKNTGMFLGELHPRFQELLGLLENQYSPDEVRIAIEGPKHEEKKPQVEVPPPALLSPEELALYKVFKTIGVPKEIAKGESRVALVPKVVLKLRQLGFGVKIEKGAGEAAGFTDKDFELSGAEIVETEQLWSTADIVIKIREPVMHPILNVHEAELAKKIGLLVCGIDPAAHKDATEMLLKHENLSVWSMRYVPRITRAQKLDTLSSTGKLDGYRAVIEAFNHYRGFAGPQFTAAGKIDPARVFVIGCGVIGLAAIGTATGLGAKVQAFDARQKGRSDGESMGAEIVIDEDLKMDEGAGTGGYAKAMGEDYYDKQRAFFKRVLQENDIVVSTARVPGMPKLVLVTEEAVRGMKRGSVVMDVAGTNCSLTRMNEVYVDQQSGVTVSGITSFVSTMAGQASELYSNNMYNLVEELCQIPKHKSNNASNFVIDLKDEIANDAVVVQNTVLRWIPYEKKLKLEEEKKKAAAAKPESKRPPEEEKKFSPTIERRPAEAKTKTKELSQGESLAEKLLTTEMLDDYKERAADMNVASSSLIVLSISVLTIALAYSTDYGFMMNFLIFTLALVIGYIVVWGVDPLLHASLMSETNAISGIIVIGAMLQLYGFSGSFELPNVLGTLALFFASINVFGGFTLTDRMLRMISC